jgi:hypothetical protein
MKLFRKLTLVESLTLIAIVAFLAALILVPGSATASRLRLERRARDWKPGPISVLSDSTLIAADEAITGEWIKRGRLFHASFSFAERDDGKYDVNFSTGGCLGGCKFSRTAAVDNGLITLNAAVAEYMPNTYLSLYIIRIGGSAYLLPTTSVVDFEREIAVGTDQWEHYVLRRPDSSDAHVGLSRPTPANGK